MNSNKRWTQMLLALMVGMVCLTLALSVSAQVQTTTTTTSHPSTVTTKIERGEVVYVNGRDLIVKMDDGSLRHFSNVPDSATAMVDGKEIHIQDAKVGMKLEKTVITTSTPKTITTTQTVTGKVFYIQPPTNVILTLQDGTNQKFKIPKGQKFNVDGQMVDAWGLKKGMQVSATKIVEEPVTEIAKQQQLTGTMPPPPPPPPPDQPIMIAVLMPAPAPPAAPAALPKTGSLFPLIGLMGLASLAGSLALRAVRS
jgi:hypothetical protein